MLRNIIFILVLSFYGWNCKTQPNLNDRRKEVIKKVIKSISIYDTTELYNVIDTAYYFDADGKEGFLFTVKYLYNRFKECGTIVNDTLIKVKEAVAYSKEYSLPFCRNSNNSIKDRSFDLLVTFADYEDPEKIHFIDVKNYFDSIKIKTTEPILPPKN